MSLKSLLMMFIIQGILFENSCKCFSFVGDNTTWKTVAWKPIQLGDFFESQTLSESIQNHPKLSGINFQNRVSIRENYHRYDNEIE